MIPFSRRVPQNFAQIFADVILKVVFRTLAERLKGCPTEISTMAQEFSCAPNQRISFTLTREIGS